jgi:hypothetical protein
MKLLEAQPEIAPGAPPEPPVEHPPEEPAVDPAARTCKSCGSALEPGQDWCLACGAAAGRIGTRPGARSAMAVFGLTALLVAGAVGASYAALREDQTVPPSQSAAAAQVAQAPPPGTTVPPAATTPPASTTTTPAPGTTSTSTGKSTIPKVQVPSNTSPAPTPKATPPAVTPRQTTPPAAAPAPTPPATSTPAPSGGGSQTSPGSSTTPAPSAPVAIDLAASAVSVYDPYRRATAVGVPGKAVDGDGSTSWYADTAPGQPTVNLGFAANLGQARGIKSIDITTPTPGFKVEVYATDEATPPPSITDTRWAHITDKSDVGADGKTHIVLGAGTSKYQTLLLWITKPPSDGTRVRIAELKVFG